MHVLLKIALIRLVIIVDVPSEETIRYRHHTLDLEEVQEDLNQNLKNKAVKTVENL